MAQRFRSVSVDGVDAPADLFERNKNKVVQWSVVTTFRRGEGLQAVTGNHAEQIMIADFPGKPWLPILTDRGNCLVRTNSGKFYYFEIFGIINREDAKYAN
ncbi:hypothetical protein IQ269_21920 [Tychonema sp. LEGE 07199]|uniref:hypothetical protein n=1 Tax=unclassified Tychonema TaxID=2642144 RepID=UPI00187E72D2|nr:MULTISPECIES: hypothetical protein [unclassified Tychonema]MBE9123380.1 hypothetical protein [Tychonema sp. LEGE 07199]MBE9132091.1 hypothetical protein [Tychonema sp. LEGE 07196]